MTALAIIFGASAAIMALAAIYAPLGYEDERGFHYGEPQEDSDADADAIAKLSYRMADFMLAERAKAK